MPASWWVYTVGALLIAYSAYYTDSIPRYAMAAFPLFVAFAWKLPRTLEGAFVGVWRSCRARCSSACSVPSRNRRPHAPPLTLQPFAVVPEKEVTSVGGLAPRASQGAHPRVACQKGTRLRPGWASLPEGLRSEGWGTRIRSPGGKRERNGSSGLHWDFGPARPCDEAFHS